MPGRKSARAAALSDDDEDRLIDTTGTLQLRSKRSERRRKRLEKKSHSPPTSRLLDLPTELLVDILSHLKPSQILQASRVNKALRRIIAGAENVLANVAIRGRYACLAKCLRLPVLLHNVDPAAHRMLQSEARQELLAIHKRPYQHVLPPDSSAVCTCLTCILRWNSLCLAVDFAHWQHHLDKGEPIPTIARGTVPAWNRQLLGRHAAIVSKALHHRLWYACILQVHLATTVRSIRRNAQNKGNKRKRFRLPQGQQDIETDDFLLAKGPSTLDFPFHRDNYYMLEAYLPNRSWNGDENRWMYVPDEQHDTDVGFVVNWAARREQARGHVAEGTLPNTPQ